MAAGNHFKSQRETTSVENLLAGTEDETLEFKEAKQSYPFDKLAKYCCAIANSGGGKLVLGVTDRRPRSVVGTQAFSQLEEARRSLTERIPLMITVREEAVDGKRVLVFNIPARPVGMPLQYRGIYWSRVADSLVPMSPNELRQVFGEAAYDFSAEVCPGATVDSLDVVCIETFRKRWQRKSRNSRIRSLSRSQLLRDADLLSDAGLTYAALILFGKRDAIRQFLAQAEVVFEYRSSDVSGPAQQRVEYPSGFFAYYEKLWETVNLRNDLQHYQEGLFVFDIPTLEERSVREVLLNAVSHRDYQLGGSIFVRQYPRRLTVESPGGLPAGITIENILDRQLPRNRRIAEAFARCGLVERSGQGMNLMFERSIQQGKGRPDFTGTDDFHVSVTLQGDVRDVRFLQFMQQIGRERLVAFNTHDFLALDYVHQERKVPAYLRDSLRKLTEMGVIERVGRGRGTRYLLSRRFYADIRKPGVYTRKKGLDRRTNRQLLLKHIEDNARDGSTMSDFQQVLPGCTRGQIRSLLRDLKLSGAVRVSGRTRGAKWYPGDTDCA